jgi:hypothetical protein
MERKPMCPTTATPPSTARRSPTPRSANACHALRSLIEASEMILGEFDEYDTDEEPLTPGSRDAAEARNRSVRAYAELKAAVEVAKRFA